MSSATAPPAVSRSASVGLVILMLSTFVAISSESMPVGLLKPMSVDVHVSESTMGLLISAYAVVVAGLSIPLTFATARLPRKRLLLGTLLGYGASNLVIAIAPSFGVLVAGRVIGGIAHAVFFAVISGYAVQLVPARLAGRAIAIAFAGSSLGFTLGVPLGTTLGNAVGWRETFAILAGVAGLLIVLALVALPAVQGETHPEEHGRRGIWRSGLVLVGIVNAVVFLGHYIAYTYISPLLTRTGLPLSSLGLVFLVLGVAGIIGLVGAGTVIDRRPRIGLLVSVAIMAIALGGLAFMTHTVAGSLVAASLWTLGFGGVPTFFMSAAIRTHAVTADLAGAVVNATSNLGIAIGSVVGAQTFAAAGAGVLPPFAAVVVAIALVVALFARVAFPSRPPEARDSYIEAITGSFPVVTAPIQIIRPQ